jgi:hypothetical protein
MISTCTIYIYSKEHVTEEPGKYLPHLQNIATGQIVKITSLPGVLNFFNRNIIFRQNVSNVIHQALMALLCDYKKKWRGII